MNHFMLPRRKVGREVISSSARYGTYAMEVLINHLLKMGAAQPAGSQGFRRRRGDGNLASSNVGARNAEFVLDYLKTEKFRWWPRICSIPIRARSITFPPAVASWSKKLHRVHNETLFSREREYKARLTTAKVEGDVELFI